jgi:hypothetical protein
MLTLRQAKHSHTFHLHPTQFVIEGGLDRFACDSRFLIVKSIGVTG